MIAILCLLAVIGAWAIGCSVMDMITGAKPRVTVRLNPMLQRDFK